MRKYEYKIDEIFDGKKIQDYLKGELKYSSRLIKILKRQDNGILLNSSHARTIDLMSCGDMLEINIPDDAAPARGSDAYAPVVYCDDDIIIFDKPAFMPVHPTRNHQGDTLANACSSYLERLGVFAAFRPVNRLDRDTTGLVLCGINQYSASRLGTGVEKVYYAVVCGEMSGSGTIDAPIARKNERLITREVASNGVRAVTHWRAILYNGEFTLVEVRLETGRTHQIRVHFSHIGRPLAGDTMYGTADGRIARQALHCARMSFIHPVSNELLEFESEIPIDMKRLIECERSHLK